MKILMLAENWAPRIGGIERYLAGIGKFLVKEGHEVVVVATKIKSVKLKAKNYGRGDELRVIRKRFFIPLMKPKWLLLGRYLLALHQQEKFDLVLGGKGLFEGLAALYLKKITGVKYVFFTYGMEVEEWAARRQTRRKLLKAAGGAERIFYINQETKRRLVDLGILPGKLSFLPPGVGEFWFKEAGTKEILDILRECAIKQPYILCVARLVPRKGIDDLIQAFSRIDQTRFGQVSLVIAGEGPEAGNLSRLVEKEMLGEAVAFVGGASNQELRALYAGAEFFAMTPKRIGRDMEGFGIVYLEAAAQGKPAVASDCGGANEAVLNGVTGLVVKEGDVAAVTSALEKLLGDKELVDKLGFAAQRRARREFAWNEWVSKISV